ncbi:MAG: hypothetical protein KGK10_13510 [Rhodospirillales bacterium]|nr:hypothetical protein [Rhodospirillales bacterium]
MMNKTSMAASGTETLEAAQRGFAAFGAAQEQTLKALMRAATRQAELAREAMSDCMTAAAGMHLPAGPEDGQEQMRRANLAAETWFRTWRSITDDLRHDLLEAADTMLAGMPLPPSAAAPASPPAAHGAPRRPTSAH